MTREIISQWECMFTLNLCKCRQVRHCVEQLSILWSPKEQALLLPATLPWDNSAYWPVPGPIVTLAIIILVTLGLFRLNIGRLHCRPWHRAWNLTTTFLGPPECDITLRSLRTFGWIIGSKRFFLIFLSLMITSCWRDFFFAESQTIRQTSITPRASAISEFWLRFCGWPKYPLYTAYYYHGNDNRTWSRDDELLKWMLLSAHIYHNPNRWSCRSSFCCFYLDIMSKKRLSVSC